MSAPASPTRGKRNADLRARRREPESEAIARIAPAPAQTPSTAATIGCGQRAHRLDEGARHARELEQLGHVERPTSGPMISSTSPPEQKFPPAPVSTIARMSGSLRDRSNQSRSVA